MPTDTSGRWLPDLPDHDVVREVGRGGMGMVYEAVERRSGARVALKTLQAFDAAALYRFKQEFRGFADVLHPNLVALHELRSDGSVWYFTMELVEGRHMLTYLRDHPDRLRGAFAQLADGLSALHAAGKVHRDVKPGNVLVTGECRVVLLDFGLAAELAADGLHRSTKSHVLGTVPYMSPEQASGKPVGPAGDWYAVGVMLYEALTGRLPFAGDALQILIEKRSTEPPPPSAAIAGVPEDLDALCAELLRRDPAARPVAADVRRRLGATPAADPAAASVPASARIVGRGPQLAALAAAFEETRGRRPVAVHIRGRSGIGKSALMHAFLEDVARSADAVVLSGRCYERESVPYKAFDSPIDALSRHLSRLPDVEGAALLPRDVASLTRLFPVLRRVAVVARAPQRAEIPEPHEARRRAVLALRELFARIADRHPLVLAIDDLQWGDADSAGLLADLMRPPDPPVLLVLLSYRSEDAASSPFLCAFAEFISSDTIERRDVAVEPLTPEESERLAMSRLGDSGDRTRAAAIVREAGGSPLFVIALADHAQTGGPLAAGEPGSGAVSLDALLMDGIGRLPPDARRLLEVAAVAGRPIPVAVAARAAGLDAGGRAALAALRSARLARLAGSNELGDLDTYHDRVRETALAHISGDDLRVHHERLADALDAAGGADPEMLARHLRGAGQLDRAARCTEEAATNAAKALAFDHAADLYSAALELSSAAGGERKRVLRLLADAQTNARRGGDAARTYLDAAKLAEGTEELDLRRRAGEQLLVSGRVDEGLAVLAPVLGSFGIALAPSAGRALVRLLVRRAILRLRGLSYKLRREDEIAPRELLRFDAVQGVAHYYAHYDVIRTVDLQSLAVLLALRLGEPRRLVRSFVVESGFSAMAGPRAHSRSERLFRAAHALATQLDEAWPHAFVGMARGFAAFFEGRWRVAHGHLISCLPSMRERCTGVAWEIDESIFFDLLSLEFLGEMGEFRRGLDPALDDAGRRGDRFAETYLRLRACYVKHLLDDVPERAMDEVSRTMATLGRAGHVVLEFYAWQARTDVATYTGDVAAARMSVAKYATAYARTLLGRIDIIDASVHLIRARTALAAATAAGCGEGARRALSSEARDLARRLARGGTPYKVAWSLGIRAGVASVRGDRAEALSLLASAEDAFRTADMPLYADVMRLRRGEVLGGEHGREVAVEAAAAIAARTVKNPARWADMYAPGFPR